MDDEYEVNNGDILVQTTQEGYCSRLVDSWCWLCVGIILMNASTILLFWNEGQNVSTLMDLEESEKLVTSLSNVATVDSAYEGKVVHVTASTSVGGQILTDPVFDVSRSNSIRLWRRVETYQWVERSETVKTSNVGGSSTNTKTYTYTKQWLSGIQSSANFRQRNGHENPTAPLYVNFFARANPITLGAYVLPDLIIESISGSVVTSGGWWNNITDVSAYPAPANVPQNKIVTKSGMYFYFTEGVASRQVGDTRVSFAYMPVGTISILAEQRGNSFVPYETTRGGRLLLVEKGSLTAEEMLEEAETENRTTTWIVRGLGWLLSFIGFMMCFEPCTTFADIVPFLSDILEIGICCIALVVTALLSGAVIGLAWLFYRPTIGGAIIAGLVVLGAGIFLFSRYRKSQGFKGYDQHDETEHDQLSSTPGAYLNDNSKGRLPGGDFADALG